MFVICGIHYQEMFRQQSLMFIKTNMHGYGIEKNNQTHLFVLRDFCNNFRGDSGVNL